MCWRKNQINKIPLNNYLFSLYEIYTYRTLFQLDLLKGLNDENHEDSSLGTSSTWFSRVFNISTNSSRNLFFRGCLSIGAELCICFIFSIASLRLRPYHSASSSGMMCFLYFSYTSSRLVGLSERKSFLARARSKVLFILKPRRDFKSWGGV